MGNAKTVNNRIITLCSTVCLFMAAHAFAWSLIVALATPALAQKSSISISEKTKYYRITGKSAPEFAVSMAKKGPYSRSHRRRAWATATRDMTYQLFHRRTKKSCKIKAVKVKLNVIYEMPKLTSKKGCFAKTTVQMVKNVWLVKQARAYPWPLLQAVCKKSLCRTS
ncbi:MAG: DUF922 domain-containing protein [Rhizobiaceae bacterium]|nr:DUF922 domain-containing protein [Rhizobiaceae bacterium]